MKKNIIAVLLVVALVIPIFSIPASATNDEGITFRGIPWGTPFSEVLRELKEDGIETDDILYKCVSDPSYSFVIYTAFPNVGGYRASASIYFIDPDEQSCKYKGGVYTTSLSNVSEVYDEAILYFAYYHLRFEQSTLSKSEYEKKVNEIYLKLQKLYGKEDSMKKDRKYEYVWKGANGTQVRLEAYQNSDMSPSVNVYYEWEDGESLRVNHFNIEKKKEEAKEAIEKREREAKEAKEAEEYLESVLSNVDGF